jgi:metacaspase-1
MAKTALCIGINDYPGTDLDLKGCVNDANDWADVLAARGFEAQRLLNRQATLAAMREAFRHVVGAAAAGDSVVITYSGHGTYAPDENGDESDGLDEALCPHDIERAGAFIDDEIHEIFATRQPGVRLMLISDSCHSGTVTRAAAGEPEAADAPRARFLPMGNWLPQSRLPRAIAGGAKLRLAAGAAGSPFAKAMLRRADDLLLAGCEEGPDSYSYDAVMHNRPNGAFTYYALKALAALPPHATYAQWHKAIYPKYLPTLLYPQTPRLVGSVAARRRVVFA